MQASATVESLYWWIASFLRGGISVSCRCKFFSADRNGYSSQRECVDETAKSFCVSPRGEITVIALLSVYKSICIVWFDELVHLKTSGPSLSIAHRVALARA